MKGVKRDAAGKSLVLSKTWTVNCVLAMTTLFRGGTSTSMVF